MRNKSERLIGEAHKPWNRRGEKKKTCKSTNKRGKQKVVEGILATRR